MFPDGCTPEKILSINIPPKTIKTLYKL